MGYAEIIAAVLVIIGILIARTIVNILPSLAACMVRWKECVHLENSVHLSRDRNIFAVYLILPFCLVAAEYRLYSPDFLSGLPPFAYFACIFGIFAAYCLLRILLAAAVRQKKLNEKIRKAGFRTSFSFFCIMATVVLTAAGICSFSGISDAATKTVLLYCILAVYLVFILRKFQIFQNSCAFFSAFLYLCVLEILPVAILVLSAAFL